MRCVSARGHTSKYTHRTHVHAHRTEHTVHTRHTTHTCAASLQATMAEDNEQLRRMSEAAEEANDSVQAEKRERRASIKMVRRNWLCFASFPHPPPETEQQVCPRTCAGVKTVPHLPHLPTLLSTGRASGRGGAPAPHRRAGPTGQVTELASHHLNLMITISLPQQSNFFYAHVRSPNQDNKVFPPCF